MGHYSVWLYNILNLPAILHLNKKGTLLKRTPGEGGMLRYIIVRMFLQVQTVNSFLKKNDFLRRRRNHTFLFRLFFLSDLNIVLILVDISVHKMIRWIKSHVKKRRSIYSNSNIQLRQWDSESGVSVQVPQLLARETWGAVYFSGIVTERVRILKCWMNNQKRLHPWWWTEPYEECQKP